MKTYPAITHITRTFSHRYLHLNSTKLDLDNEMDYL